MINWSVNKVLDAQPSGFERARAKIVFCILFFTIAKMLIVAGFTAVSGQNLQLARSLFMIFAYVGFVLFVLQKPDSKEIIAHIMIVLGMVMVTLNIYFFAHRINLLTVQFAFMISVSSFFILGSKMGVIYSSLTFLPILIFVFTGNPLSISPNYQPGEFASPGFEILVILNFVTIVIVHYMYFDAIKGNLREKEAMNAELSLAITEAKKLAEARSDFLSTMSHELRTPLNAVIAIAEMLRDDNPAERQKENLRLLHLSAVDLLSLINNILDFNKLEYEKLNLEKTPFHLANFMQNICSVIRVKAANKQLSLVLDLDPRLNNVVVITDPLRLAQVIYNLAGNAVKYTDEGSITVGVRLVETDAPNVELEVSVTDTGIGIPEFLKEKVFERFTQVSGLEGQARGGTGLGLAIVKQILLLFGSSIHLETAQGNGSRFSFTLNVTVSNGNAELLNTPREVVEESNFGSIKLLIAEDDHVNRVVLRKQLAKLNIEAEIVNNGQEALDAIQKMKFDAVFLDLHMPIVDGYTAIAAIRSMADADISGIYAIAFTAAVTEQQRILTSGFNDYLYKPVNLNELKSKIVNIMEYKIRNHSKATD